MIKDLFHKIDEKINPFSERYKARKELAKVDKRLAEAPLNTSLLNEMLAKLPDEESRWKCIEENFEDKLFLSDDGWYWGVWTLGSYWMWQAEEAGAASKYPICIVGMANPDACGDTLRIPYEIRLNGITLNVMGVWGNPTIEHLTRKYGLTHSENFLFNDISAEYLEIPDTVVIVSGINFLPNLRELKLSDKLMWFEGFNNCPKLESVKFGSLPFEIRGSYFTECPALHRIEIKSFQWLIQQQKIEMDKYMSMEDTFGGFYDYSYIYPRIDGIIIKGRNPDTGMPLEINMREASTINFTDDWDEMHELLYEDYTAWICNLIKHIIFPEDSHVVLDILTEGYGIFVSKKAVRDGIFKNEWWNNTFQIHLQELPSLEDVTLPPDSWIYDEIEPAEDDEVLEVDKRKYVRLTPANASRYESRFGCRLLLSWD